MKTTIRFISVALILAMLFSIFTITPVTVSAADTNSDFTYKVLYDNYIQLTKYTGTDTKVTVPAKIGEYIVVGIGSLVFQKNKTIEEIEISSGIEYIKKYAFRSCTKLNKVTIPATVESIGMFAFNSTAYLKDEANWEDGVLYLDDCMLRYKGNAEKVEIKEGTRLIADSCFFDNYTVKECTFPETLEHIGASAFFSVPLTCDLVFPAGLKSIGASAFRNADSKKVILQPGCEYIGESAFPYKNLNYVQLPSDLQIIPDSLFSGCRKLKSIALPNSLIYIGFKAFSRCGMKSVKIPKSVEYIGPYAFSYSQLSSITLPNKYIELGWSVFTGTPLKDKTKNWYNNGLYVGKHLVDAKNVQKLKIKRGTKYIASYVCNGYSKLKSVTIPDTVIAVGTKSFIDCESLYSVTIPASVERIGDMAFGITNIDDKYYRYAEFKIKGIPNSTAHAYAKAYGFEFVDKSAAKSIKLKVTKITLKKGETYNLKAIVKPAIAKGAIKYKSSNKAVAKVNKIGVVTALKKGKATITVKTANGKTATCKVTVN